MIEYKSNLPISFTSWLLDWNRGNCNVAIETALRYMVETSNESTLNWWYNYKKSTTNPFSCFTALTCISSFTFDSIHNVTTSSYKGNAYPVISTQLAKPPLVGEFPSQGSTAHAFLWYFLCREEGVEQTMEFVADLTRHDAHVTSLQRALSTQILQTIFWQYSLFSVDR